MDGEIHDEANGRNFAKAPKIENNGTTRFCKTISKKHEKSTSTQSNFILFREQATSKGQWHSTGGT
jgi:hypothetical protein